MADERDGEDRGPLDCGMNAAQRWQAVVTQFNAALAIQQDLQRRVYESKFDQMRDATNATIAGLQLSRQQLNQQLCESLERLDGRLDELHALRARKAELEATLAAEKAVCGKLQDLHKRLNEKEAEQTREVEAARNREEAELQALDARKAELRETVKDLKGFLVMHAKLDKLGVDPQAPIVTLTKATKKS